MDQEALRRRRQDARRRVYRRRRLVAAGAAGLVALVVLAIGLLVAGGGGDEPEANGEPRPAELPRGGRTILPGKRVVAFYGAPQDRELGVLGIGSPRLAARKLERQARPYARPGRPVVPAVIRGTRHALPPKKGWHAPGRIEIEFLEPLIAEATAPDEAAVELRERARSAILDELNEPDLAAVA